MLTTIALAVTLHLQSHQPKVSLDALIKAQEEAALCQPLGFGMPYISMQNVDAQQRGWRMCSDL